MKKIVFILLTLSINSSCSFFNKEKVIIEKSNDEIIKEKRNKVIRFFDSIGTNENIKYILDTLSYKYSIDFKDDFFVNNLLLNYFDVIDIYKKNNEYHIKIETSMKNANLYIDLKTNKETALTIRKEIEKNNTDDDLIDYDFIDYDDDDNMKDLLIYPNKKLLIIQINKLKKIDISIESFLTDYDITCYCSNEDEDDYEYDLDDYTIELDDEVSNSFFGKGTIIKYIKNNDYETN